jgi:predicted nucleic acid-binding protein
MGATASRAPDTVIHLDTSLLIDALTGKRQSAHRLRAAIESGERVGLSCIVLYEWLRGPRLESEIEAQEALFPRAQATPFGPAEAEVAAVLYRSVSRPRGRDIDLAVAATALTHRARLWTLDPGDFRDIPGLSLYPPDA